MINVASGGDVRIWLILALALAARLVLVTSEPMGHHSWRQTDTAGVARNFARESMNILEPRVDWRGNGSGRVEMEFPIFPWTVAAIYKIIGEHIAVARILSAIAAVCTTLLIYRLTRSLYGEAMALLASSVFALMPTAVFFGRAVMPESWMLLAQVGAVYAMMRWHDAPGDADRGATGTRWLWIAAASMAAAVVIKLPSLHIGLPIIWLAVSRLGWKRTLTDWRMYACVAIVLAPTLAWYGYSASIRASTGLSFGVSGSDKWGLPTMLLTLDWWRTCFVGKIIEDHLAIVGAPIFALGLLWPRKSSRERVVDVWLCAFVIYVLVVTKGNWAHDYYQMPCMPLFAIFMARGLGALWSLRRPVAVAAAVAMLAMFALTGIKLFRKELPERFPRYDLAMALAQATAPGQLVFVMADQPHADPTVLYLADRQGWCGGPDYAAAANLRELRSHGCAAIAFDTRDPDQNSNVQVLRALLSDTAEVITTRGGVVFVWRDK